MERRAAAEEDESGQERIPNFDQAAGYARGKPGSGECTWAMKSADVHVDGRGTDKI